MRFASIAAAAAAAVFITVGITVFSQQSEIDRCRVFLQSYGWKTDDVYIDSDSVKIPYEFDEVYKSYDKIQSEAGLSLVPYRGMSGTRYTFLITNYPIDTGENVYANIIVISGTPVAGDVMTVNINGFMHSLKFPV